MVKTIKFNLVCDNYQVRTLEDLRNHFSIEDVLQYYRDGVLEKWLFVRGYINELNAIKQIANSSPLDIINSLVGIFKVEEDPEKIQYSTSIIKYREDRILAIENESEKLSNSNSLYREYFDRYEKLTKDILDSPKDKVRIQAAITEIVNQYSWIFNIDYRNFFYKVRDTSPLAILCLLMNPYTRKYYINDGEETGKDDSLYERDKKEMYKWLKEFCSDENNFSAIGDCLETKSANTNNYPVKLSETQCLLLKMHSNCGVCEDRLNAEILEAKSVNDNYIIINSLLYVSNSDYGNTIYYVKI